MSMDYEWEIHTAGLTRQIKVKTHAYDLVEFTIKQKLDDENGKNITDTGYTSFYSTKEFIEFFGPIINELKVRLDNANSIQE
jgi:hypothetical protein